MKRDITILIFAAIVLLTSACGGINQTANQPTSEVVVIDQVSTSTELPESTATAEPTPTEQPLPSPTPLAITDGLGRDILLTGPAQKIISLAPSNTEILFAIGARAQVAGRDTFSDYPAEAAEAADIGGGWGEINTELILSLEPDLVLAAEINAKEQVEALEKLGLKVFYLANPTDLEGMYDNLRIVAMLTGRTTEAEALIGGLTDRVAAVDAALASVEERPLVFYELDGTEPNAPWTSGPGTFIDLLITQAGGTNLGGMLDGAWAQLSIETLIEQNPEIILLGDAVWGGVTAEAVAQRAGWDTLDAVQNGKVFPFDDNLVSRPGPRLVEGLEQLAKLLHPEAFE